MANQTPIITENVFVIADTHFGHKTVTTFEPTRQLLTDEGGFENQEEMLISRWNSVVTDKDTVLILGDFAFRNIGMYTSRLNGNKVLIRGNHDRASSHAYISAGFKHTYDTISIQSWMQVFNYENDDPYLSGLMMDYRGQRILFSHYPVDTYEEFYTKQRYQDLTDRVRRLTGVAKNMGITLNVHGHLHSTIREDTYLFKYLNVSCECIDYTPIRLKDLFDAAGL